LLLQVTINGPCVGASSLAVGGEGQWCIKQQESNYDYACHGCVWFVFVAASPDMKRRMVMVRDHTAE